MTTQAPAVIDVPTAWKEMRYCIVAALQSMGDDGPWYGGEIQFEVARLFTTDAGYVDWDFRSAYGKAWHRALDELREQGVVTFGDLEGYRLAVWGEPS